MTNCGTAVVCGDEAFITHSILFIYFKNMQTSIFRNIASYIDDEPDLEKKIIWISILEGK